MVKFCSRSPKKLKKIMVWLIAVYTSSSVLELAFGFKGHIHMPKKAWKCNVLEIASFCLYGGLGRSGSSLHRDSLINSHNYVFVSCMSNGHTLWAYYTGDIITAGYPV